METLTPISTVDYLQEVVPPCLPTELSAPNPCEPLTPRRVEVLSVMSEGAVWPFKEGVPTFEEILLGQGAITLSAYLVVRGIAQKGSTRCEVYPVWLPNYRQTVMRRQMESSFHHYFCFIDLSVNEYIVGEGPSKLTVAIHREVLLYLDDWEDEKDYILNYLEDPQSRTASVYEGKELVLFLSIPLTIAVEAWHVNGLFDIWFVQKGSDGAIRAVAQEVTNAITNEQRSKLNIPLTELTKMVQEAATQRTSITGGRIRNDPTLPLLVTDANFLQDYYVSVGAVYDDSEGATVLPPPVPGEGDPAAPTIPANEGTTGDQRDFQ